MHEDKYIKDTFKYRITILILFHHNQKIYPREYYHIYRYFPITGNFIFHIIYFFKIFIIFF